MALDISNPLALPVLNAANPLAASPAASIQNIDQPNGLPAPSGGPTPPPVVVVVNIAAPAGSVSQNTELPVTMTVPLNIDQPLAFVAVTTEQEP